MQYVTLPEFSVEPTRQFEELLREQAEEESRIPILEIKRFLLRVRQYRHPVKGHEIYQAVLVDGVRTGMDLLYRRMENDTCA